MFTSIKTQEEKLETMDSIMKKKTPKIEKLHIKAESAKEISMNGTCGHYHDHATKAAEYGMKRDESEPDLRTSCPNIFRKF